MISSLERVKEVPSSTNGPGSPSGFRPFSLWGICSQVGLTILLLAMVFGCLEFGTRLMAKPPRSTLGVVLENAAYAYHPWASHRMTPGFTFQNMSINKYGWRGKEYPKEKPPGVKRVLLLGDSVAFSSFYIKDDVTIAGYLEAILKAKTDQPWEVLNLAVPGGIGQIATATMAHEGVHFHPDIAVALNGANDLPILLGRGELGAAPFGAVQWDGIQIRMSQLYDPRTGRGQPRENLMLLLNESAFFRRFAQPLLMGIAPQTRWPSTIERPERLDSFVESQVALHFLAKGSGATFIHFIQPFLSKTHKKIGKSEQQALKNAEKQWGPGLFDFYDAAFPVLRQKMSAAAVRYGFRSVDLSLLFTAEDVFRDQVHIDANITGPTEHPANCKVALRIAEAILVEQGKTVTMGERCEGQILSGTALQDAR
jgi:hypothetical protein